MNLIFYLVIAFVTFYVIQKLGKEIMINPNESQGMQHADLQFIYTVAMFLGILWFVGIPLLVFVFLIIFAVKFFKK